MNSIEKIPFKIDPEFEVIAPPLTEEVYAGLKADIRKRGCRVPVTIWRSDKNHDYLLVDGHHRYKICQELKISMPEPEILTGCRHRDDARDWIVTNQINHRQLTPYENGVMAWRAAIARYGKRARDNQGERTDLSQKSVRSIDMQKIAATMAHLSHDTMARIKVIMDEASEETKVQLSRGETTINREYLKLRPKKAKPRVENEGPVPARSPMINPPVQGSLIEEVCSDMQNRGLEHSDRLDHREWIETCWRMRKWFDDFIREAEGANNDGL
jgi:ParB/Sulfiredoxin domain